MYPLYHEKEQLRLHVFFCFKKDNGIAEFSEKANNTFAGHILCNE